MSEAGADAIAQPKKKARRHFPVQLLVEIIGDDHVFDGLGEALQAYRGLPAASRESHPTDSAKAGS